MGSRNLDKIKHLWRVYEEKGQKAGMDVLLANCDDRSEFRPYTAEGRLLRGPEEFRAFFETATANGTTVNAVAHQFMQDGAKVEVLGSIRVTRGTGGLADAQVRWSYHFDEDGVIRCAEYAPLGASSEHQDESAGRV